MFSKTATTLVWTKNHETLKLMPLGPDCIRVMCTMEPSFEPGDWMLLPPGQSAPQISIEDDKAVMHNGLLTAVIDSEGRISFFKNGCEEPLVEEYETTHAYNYSGRYFRSNHGRLYHVEARFKAYEDEHIYGLGQHQHGFLDQKGCIIPLHQLNSEVSVPFLYSSRGYGVLWNNPSIGQVELARNRTCWTAQSSRQLDYLVMTGTTPAAIMERYADCTGRSPMMPEWAAGFWQCRLRYETQEELLAVAREHTRRGLPISVIVIDYFHWTKMGDWKFDPKCWPDPDGMVKELEEMGIKTMVSIWPTVNPDSENFETMEEKGLLARGERGCYAHHRFSDTYEDGIKDIHYYDPFHPDAREFIWEKMKENYCKYGINTFWLDACEPECKPDDPDNIRYHLGNAMEVGNLYPYYHEKAFYDGMSKDGQEDIVLLCRSAWAGSQRFGSLVWSGDIYSTFESLRKQVKAGLNIGMSGIPWWTTDIGGFYGGKNDDPVFRELIVRWFQFGVFCPVFRLHGHREMWDPKKGAENEVWSFGEEAYTHITRQMFLRETLKPYVLEQMQQAHKHGTPVMRPLFFDFPDDPVCYTIEDQYMFGPEFLVAPVLEHGAVTRQVYLPEGADWYNAWTGETLPGGQSVCADTPLDHIAVYVKNPQFLQLCGNA